MQRWYTEKWALAIVGHVGTQPDLLEALRREWPRLRPALKGGRGGARSGGPLAQKPWFGRV